MAVVRFVLVFAVLFGALLWLFDGDGPVPAFNSGIGALTDVQTRGAGFLVSLTGEPVTSEDTVLRGPGFACQVDTGCNGMSAVVLLLAGILSFPGAVLRARLLGILVLVPAVLLLNIVRIAALYWTGAHYPQWFGTSHVYVWQTVVIVVTAFLWLAWLSWKSRPAAAS
jgi:exosortase/archaeosortase family protein